MPTSRFRRIMFAAFAALLLLTGALNIRSAFGGDPPWVADPADRSPVDALIGAPRLPTALDNQIAAMQDALRNDPRNGQAATLLGQAYLQKAWEIGDPSYYPKAEELFRLALEQHDKDVAAMVGMGTLALARHQFPAALEWGERARAINPHHPAAYGVIGDAQIELGRYDEAASTIQAMVDLRPDLPSFARVSYLRELHGDVTGAIAAMEQAAAAGAAIPENVAWAQTQLGNLAFGQGDLAHAQGHYEASLRTRPGYVFGTAGLAKIAAARGDLDRAIALYSEALQIMPAPEFAIALGEVYLAAGRPDEAAAQFALVEAMTALSQENGVDTDVELALFVADHGGNLDDALAWAETSYASCPSIQNADALAWVRFRAGDLDGAWAVSQEALRLGTKDARMHFHAGMIAAARGDHANATALFEAALAINPHFSVLHVDEARETLSRIDTATL
ncbi:MAG: tetratricopeptide repeat protein [Thermomicrobiales bacterium]